MRIFLILLNICTTATAATTAVAETTNTIANKTREKQEMIKIAFGRNNKSFERALKKYKKKFEKIG